MPNINDINGVTVANLAKLDAVLKANISTVNGLTLSAAAAFLLDTYTGAAAGYSTRRLASSATVLMRVRRETAGGTGDDDEADVAYDSNNELSLDSAISNASAGVTATTLGEFINVGTVGGTTYSNPDSLTVTASCAVDEWKDQSGNSNHLTQSTAGNQPLIHNGTVNTDLIQDNGKPAIDFTPASRHAFNLTTGIEPNTIIMVSQPSTQLFCYSWNELNNDKSHRTLSGDWLLDITGSTDWFNENNGDSYLNGSQVTGRPAADFQHLYFGWNTSPATGTFTAFSNTANVGGGNRGWDGTLQETILYTNTSYTDSTNRTGIEENINSEFLIYQPTDAPTSGLLATYTGAAAAYSVRQLSDKAVIAMRIRRDSDDEERNIGFDSNGDLATADISAFCGTANGYVVEWADQSTNGNHATQSTSGSQPQIYNGTAVITENGNAALQFDGSDDFMSASGGAWSRLAFAGVMYIDVPDDSVVLQYGENTTRFNVGVGGISSANKIGSRIYDGAFFGDDGADITDGQYLVYNDASISPDTNDMYLNGSAVTQAYGTRSGLPSVSTYTIGIRGSGGFNFLGKFQELVMWESDQSTNRTGIETNINGYFSIY